MFLEESGGFGSFRTLPRAEHLGRKKKVSIQIVGHPGRDIALELTACHKTMYSGWNARSGEGGSMGRDVKKVERRREDNWG